MNKYSKTALKTTATVGMSLAMVLSGMAAPVKAATTTLVCKENAKYNTTKAFQSKEFVGIVTGEATIKKTIDAKPLEALVLKDKVLVPAYLGFVETKGGAVTKLTKNSADVAKIKNEASFGYYAKETGTVRNEDNVVVNIAQDEPLEVTVITTEMIDSLNRDVATVKADMDKYIKSVTDIKVIKWGADIKGNSTIAVTNDKNVAVYPSVKVTYDTGSDTNITTDPTTGVTDDKTITVKTTVESEIIDYTCTTVTTAKGITIEGNTHASNVYSEIVKALDAKKVSFDTIKNGDEISFTGSNTAELGKMVILTGTEANPTMNLDFKETLKNLSKYISASSDEGKAIERFLNIEKSMTDMFGTDGFLAQALKYDEDHEFKTTADYIKVVDLLADFTDFETYLTNLSSATTDKVTAARETLQTLVDGYVAENDGDLIDAYLTSLDKYYEKFVDENGDAGITKANVDSAIKNIKNGLTFTDLKGKEVVITKADYSTFKDNAGVEEYMTKFEDMYTEITAVKDAVSKTNEAYKELVKGNPSVKKFLTGKDSDRKLNTENAFGTVKAELSLEEFNILKAYKEEVLDVVFTMESKEVGTTYVNKSTKSIFATKAQLASVLANISNVADSTKGILTALDKETGEFNWDKLVAHMDKVATSYAALTKGIEKLDSVSLVTGDRVAILAADDAIYFLQGAGKGNLTAAETRTVNNAERKVTELMNAYRNKFGSLDVQVNGWVNRGNGDWAYYENGNAVTKWVAAGTNWFYVKDGVMLRNSWVANNSIGSKWYYVNNEGQMVSNTTVNGYVFDVNGVWVKNPTVPTVETQENNDTNTYDYLTVEEGRG